MFWDTAADELPQYTLDDCAQRAVLFGEPLGVDAQERLDVWARTSPAPASRPSPPATERTPISICGREKWYLTYGFRRPLESAPATW